ncbi:hypothetical protein AURDEDRAFT_121880 [Auricularia subglabra TFB-10046 SS5]|nr:hypothetical protein AURDEDRAFT_121880 [Auricularia subglabra TFB-10046 SS5]
MSLSAILFIRLSRALPSNDTLPISVTNDEWGLRPRTMMPFNPLDTRDECFGVRMRALGTALGTQSPNNPLLRDMVGPPECERLAASKANTGLFYTALPPAVKSTTKMPKDTSLVWKTDKEVRTANAGLVGAYTCDHVLEISMVLDVLWAPGGVCQTAQAKFDAATEAAKQGLQRDLQKKIMKIRDIVNNKPNLVFFQGRVEDIKTENKKNFNNNNRHRAGSNDMDYLAMADYLLRKTKVQTVANSIDAKILELFGEDVAKVASMGEYWKEYIQFTRLVENDVEESVKAQVKKKKQEEEEAKKCVPEARRRSMGSAPPAVGKACTRADRRRLRFDRRQLDHAPHCPASAKAASLPACSSSPRRVTLGPACTACSLVSATWPAAEAHCAA